MNTRREFEWFLIGCLLTTAVLLAAPIAVMIWDGTIPMPAWVFNLLKG